MKRKRYRKRKRFIEIKTNTRGWTKVELLGFTKNNKMIIRFKNGTEAVRKIKNIRWCVTRKIGNEEPNKRWAKQFKSKKIRKKNNKNKRNKSKLKVLKEEARAKLEGG